MYPLLRWIALGILVPALLLAQKKPVTLDAISRGGPPGAGLSANWAPDGKRVAVVSEAFVRRFFEREDPIGRTVGRLRR